MQNGRDELRTHASLEAENKMARDTLEAMIADLYMQLVSGYQERKQAEQKIKRATTAINTLSSYRDVTKPMQSATNLLEKSDRPLIDPRPSKGAGPIVPR